MRLRRVLYAGMEGWTGGIRPEVQKLEVILVLLTKSYSGCSPANRIDVELYCSIAERNALECGIAAVQSHQAVIKTQLLEELRVLLRLPEIRRHGDRDRFRPMGDRKRFLRKQPIRESWQETYAERHPGQSILADKCLHNP